MAVKFSQVSEKDISMAIISGFAEEFEKFVKSDCIIIGGGPSGLMAAREIAAKGKKVLVIERNNYLGGGFWIGGFLMNKITVRHPGEKVLDELNIPYTEKTKDLFVADGPHACSKLIAAACEAGATILNMATFEDVVLRENNRVGGVVVNWTPVQALPRQITCVDPIALEAEIVVDATGHDACIAKKMEERGMLKTKGFGAMWVDKSEDLIVEYSGEIHPGLAVCGMAVSTVFGIPRMGPTFGAMLLSGKRIAEIILEKL
ncbi:MAG: thiazole biosynthesis protein [Caldiserica bacterium]|nr:thiazole biosynthesis protein [Caldisericota bacterium]